MTAAAKALFAQCGTSLLGAAHKHKSTYITMLTNVAMATASFSTKGNIALDNGTAK